MKAWIARDKDGSLYVYDSKPYKNNITELWYELFSRQIYQSDLPAGINPQWEDDEPVEVELTIKKIER